MPPLRAIMVCVDYWDFLDITLPFNRKHFETVLVVTTPEDLKSQATAIHHGAEVYTTNAFYDDGADFNKWKALEEGLDHYGRWGWLTIMDADVLWPTTLPDFPMVKDFLYAPLRRMFKDLSKPIPFSSEKWAEYPLHRNMREWAGYSQIFHAEDYHLGDPPWHEVNWKHAGGADSMFQRKWNLNCKVRPPFEVLHLGPGGSNWTGRATPYLDGTEPAEASERRQRVRKYIQQRRHHKGGDPYSHERINPSE